MANKLKGEATFSYEGEEYTLVYNGDAYCELEQVLDASFLDVIDRVSSAEKKGGKPRFSDLRTLLWAGLRARHPSVTLNQAFDMMVSGDGSIADAMTQAIEGSMPKGGEAEADANPPRKKSKGGAG